MAKKQMLFKTKGMNRDLSVSSFNPEFAFENMNLRLSTNDGNTLLSWVNEKGTKKITVASVTESQGTVEESQVILDGKAIGTAVVNHKLVVFTTGSVGNTGSDHIYVLEYKDKDKTEMGYAQYKANNIYHNCVYEGNLNFSTNNPLETLVSVEADHIEKVYWVDGRNQPRLINIKDFEDINAKVPDSGVDTQFDFVPAFDTSSATVTANTGSSGTFEPGVIQYCYTYYNKYGQQTNIVWLSPLYYLAHSDRGASPEEKVTSSFCIKIENADIHFDYVRLYSIHRTSLNAEPIVKLLDDLPITTTVITDGNASGTTAAEDIVYTDSGITGAIMDPYELLYVGGKEIIAQTFADKDDTLFVGNFEEKGGLLNGYKVTGVTINDEAKDLNLVPTATGVYTYKSQLKNGQDAITTFKGGETYRLGFQLQKKTGEWSEPVLINDTDHTCARYPTDGKGTKFTASINASSVSSVIPDGVKFVNIRPLIVYPTISDRTVLCQGVLNPTVFNALDRIDNSPFAQASWFFRPICSLEEGAKDPNYTYYPTDSDVATVTVSDTTTIPTDPNSWCPNPSEVGSFMIATVHKDQEESIIWGREVKIHRKNNLASVPEIEYLTYSFDGAVVLDPPNTPESSSSTGSTSNTSSTNTSTLGKDYKRYLFYRKCVNGVFDVWPAVSDYMTGTTNYSYEYPYLYDVEVIPQPWGMYSLSVTPHGLLCYEDNSTPPVADKILKIYTVTKTYTINFKAVPVFSDGTVNPQVAYNNGATLRYCHYQSLFTQDELMSGDGKFMKDYEKKAHLVEIQGSVKNYKSVYPSAVEDNEIKDANSNTQFFVDQNIVTLNSPDIEFDTEVQTYGTDGLKLRLVGYVPINASAAHCAIATSSAMLEPYHNRNESSDKSGGTGLMNTKVFYPVGASNPKHLVSALLWNDVYVGEDKDKEDGIYTGPSNMNYFIAPWQRTGSLNNDWRNKDVASSWLRTKKESNILFSSSSVYRDVAVNTNDTDVDTQIHLTENEFIENLRVKDKNYYPNIDKVLYNGKGYYTASDSGTTPKKKHTNPVSMKYKSTSHAVLKIGGSSQKILPSTIGSIVHLGDTYWNEEGISTQMTAPTTGSGTYLWLGELIKNPTNRFGGSTQSAVRSNKWQVAGPTVAIGNKNNGDTELTWDQGDTYYQRYDCLKTYAFTPEDTNQIVEILSFMCETHVNIDGRYDKNRGMIDNTDMSPVNFNKLNPVYSQQNNFFTYRQLDHEEEERLRYPNQMWYSKTKTPGADVDLWTNVTLASTLSLDGDKGELNALRRFNNQLLAFQDTGLSHILYNENTVLSTQQGVPVEIANSNKVSGKSYISNTVGCSNKWSIVNTPNGLYFMDSNDKGIYVFTGQLQNLSVQKGFNSWCKQMIPSGEVKWEPVNFGGTTNPGESTESTEVKNSTFTGFYDRQNQDVLWVNNDTAVAYSERVGAFTSFYDYGGTPWFENLDDTGIWVKNNSGAELWKHQAGDYCRFFGENKPYWMTLVGNPEPLTDKIFTNLEFRACVSEDGTVVPANTAGNTVERFNPLLPFDSLETWNEYQHGIANLQWKNQHGPMKHHLRDEGQTAHLNRKFRIWRCDIPRDNAQFVLPQNPTPEEQKAYDDFIADERVKGIYRMKAHPIDRMRNPWLYLKLLKNAEEDIQEGQEIQEKSLNKTEVHDVVMTFYN